MKIIAKGKKSSKNHIFIYMVFFVLSHKIILKYLYISNSSFEFI